MALLIADIRLAQGLQGQSTNAIGRFYEFTTDLPIPTTFRQPQLPAEVPPYITISYSWFDRSLIEPSRTTFKQAYG